MIPARMHTGATAAALFALLMLSFAPVRRHFLARDVLIGWPAHIPALIALEVFLHVTAVDRRADEAVAQVRQDQVGFVNHKLSERKR